MSNEFSIVQWLLALFVLLGVPYGLNYMIKLIHKATK
jgi:hypothetical protein